MQLLRPVALQEKRIAFIMCGHLPHQLRCITMGGFGNATNNKYEIIQWGPCGLLLSPAISNSQLLWLF